MSKQDNNDLLPKLALGMALFIAMKFVPKVLAWWAEEKQETNQLKIYYELLQRERTRKRSTRAKD